MCLRCDFIHLHRLFILFSALGAWILTFVIPICSHIPDNLPTPENKIDQYCYLAETCVHDTVPICGKMGEQSRTFLDLCDLLEFACDTSNVYNHVDDQPGCPTIQHNEK